MPRPGMDLPPTHPHRQWVSEGPSAGPHEARFSFSLSCSGSQGMKLESHQMDKVWGLGSDTGVKNGKEAKIQEIFQRHNWPDLVSDSM